MKRKRKMKKKSFNKKKSKKIRIRKIINTICIAVKNQNGTISNFFYQKIINTR
jgi:hypothetical protein